MANESKERVRLNLTVTPKVRDRLERLRKSSDSETLTEVVRRALTVYEETLSVRQAGGRVVFEHADGRTESVLIH